MDARPTVRPPAAPNRRGSASKTFGTIDVVMLVILIGATGCGDTWGQRAVTGGAIGAGSGAVLGAVAPVGVLPGALIGGAVGAGVGAATTPKN